MNDLILYIKSSFKKVYRIETLVSIGLLVLGVFLAIWKYELKATALTILIISSGTILAQLIIGFRHFFKFTKENDKTEKGRAIFNLILILFIISIHLILWDKRTIILSLGFGIPIGLLGRYLFKK